MFVGFRNSSETRGYFRDGLFTIAHLTARFGKLIGNGFLNARVIEVDFAIDRLVHLVDFVLCAFVFAIDFIVDRARKIVTHAHH